MSVWWREDKHWWVAKFQHQTKQYKKEGFATKGEAVLWEAQKRLEVNAEPPKEIPMVSFQELATMYLDECRPRMQLNTVRQKAYVYRTFLEHVGGDLPAVTVLTTQISDYLNMRATIDGTKTANRHLRDLKAL